jgi:hypothetical protein
LNTSNRLDLKEVNEMPAAYRVRAYAIDVGEICCASAEHWGDAKRIVRKLERDNPNCGLVTIIEKHSPKSATGWITLEKVM